MALLEVDRDSVEGILRSMPTIKYAFGLGEQESGEESTTATASSETEHGRVEAGSVYILPPVCYPEKGGKWFVKIGGGPNDFFQKGSDESSEEPTRQELDEWLASGGDPCSAAWLEDTGRSLLDGIPFAGRESMACLTTTTSPSESVAATTATAIPTTTVAPNGVVVENVLGDGSLLAVSACQGKGAGPADAVGEDIARAILRLRSPSTP